MRKIALLTLCFSACLTPAFAQIAPDFQPEKVTVFRQGDDGSTFFRIPAITVTNDGSIVAIGDRRGDTNSDLPEIISVVSRRSTDGGKTWSDIIPIALGDMSTKSDDHTQKKVTYGDASVAYDPDTNTIVCVFSGDKGFWWGTNESRNGFYVVTSTDAGLTWSEPRNFADEIYQPRWQGAFAASGSLHRVEEGPYKGRIMFVANVNTYYNRGSGSTYNVVEYVCYTDDLGASWHCATVTPPSVAAGNESKVVMLKNGNLLMSIRTKGARMFVQSEDMGATWLEPYRVPELVEPDCNGDIIRYNAPDGKSYLIHSIPNHASQRRNVSVFVSGDEGETWPARRLIVNGSSAYSALTVLPEGNIGIFVEDGTEHTAGGFNLVFAALPFEWLISNSTLSVSDLNSDDSLAPQEYFDLAGRRIESPLQQGVTIVKQGASASKMIQ